MRIGIDARMLKATGIGRYIANLVNELGQIDHDNHYILFLKKSDFDSFMLPGKNCTKILADFHWYSKGEQLYFPDIIKKQSVDLMHFPHFNVPLFYNDPFVVTIHDLTLHKFKKSRLSLKNAIKSTIKYWFYRFSINNAAKKAKMIITPSNFTKQEVTQVLKIDQKKIFVTLEGGPSAKLLNEKPDFDILASFDINKPFIFYVGNCHPHKNLHRLAQAIAILRQKYHQDVILLLAGKEDELYQQLKGFLKENKYEEFVKIIGFISDNELAALYKRASIYAFPSLNEGFGLPCLEAMAFGTPVTTSNTSCLPEILGEAAIYFNPYDLDDIVAQLNRLLTDEELRENLLVKSKEQLMKYSWSKMAKETLEIYKNSVKC